MDNERKAKPLNVKCLSGKQIAYLIRAQLWTNVKNLFAENKLVLIKEDVAALLFVSEQNLENDLAIKIMLLMMMTMILEMMMMRQMLMKLRMISTHVARNLRLAFVLCEHRK